MKRLNKTILLSGIFCLALVASRCTDLDEEPLGQLVAENYFSTADQLETGLIGAYGRLLGRWSGGLFNASQVMIPTYGADDITTGYFGNKERITQFDRFDAQADNSWNRTMYQGSYRVVNDATKVIDYADRVSGDPEQINQTVAEAHFLRGLAYLYLVRTYGNVPLITTTINLDPDEVERPELVEVYDLIVADFEAAEAVLPDTQSDPGRPNRGAAQAYLALTWLTRAGWPLEEGAASYARARDYAKTVIDNAGAYEFALLPNYADLWKKENVNHAEGVFTLQLVHTTANYGSFKWTKQGQPNEESGFEDFFAELSFFRAFPEGPRKDATFHTVFRKNVDGAYVDVPWEESLRGHPFYAKYRDYGVDEAAPDKTSIQISATLDLMRYAEVKLIFAEAQALADGTPSAEAYEAVNQIRRRAAGLDLNTPNNTVDLAPGLSAEAFQEAVVTERGWEFAAEVGIRWYDLIRTESVAEAIARRDPDELVPIVGDPGNSQKWWAPIPIQDLNKNPNLEQNPGY